jgi:polyisoprenoid-binding protein YceI
MKNKTLILALLSGVILFAFKNAPEATFAVDTNATTIKWTGYHLAKSYEHYGNIQVKSGSLEANKGAITGGEIVIDMNSISSSDLEGGKKAKLEGHLKSEDFFAVEKFPEATLVITGSESKGDNVYTTTADLTIRGITKSISFDTTVTESSKSKIVASAIIMVPRTEFEVM